MEIDFIGTLIFLFRIKIDILKNGETMGTILKLNELTKKYGNKVVVDNLNIEIEEGECSKEQAADEGYRPRRLSGISARIVHPSCSFSACRPNATDVLFRSIPRPAARWLCLVYSRTWRSTQAVRAGR